MDVDELARAASEDPERADELVSLIRNDLLRCVRLRLADPSIDAEDVLQDALVIVVRKLGRFESRGAGSFLRWAKGIARLEARKAVERTIRRRHGQAKAAFRTVLSPTTNPSSRVLRAQRLELLAEQARELSPYLQRVLADELVDGDPKQFAVRERIAVSTVRAVRWRARTRLSELVGERLAGRGVAKAGPVEARASTPSST